MTSALSRWLAAVLVMACATQALAHTSSTARMQLQIGDARSQGQWLIALRDLEAAVGLDADSNARITWGELRSARPRILAYAGANLHAWSGDEPCGVAFTDLAPVRLDDGVYAALPVSIGCHPTRLEYTALFERDRSHRALLRWQDARGSHLGVFAPATPSLRIETASRWRTSAALLEQGVGHILGGYDHLLFLVALLIPIALGAPRPQQRMRSPGGRSVPASLLMVVTAFTLGHSVTLAAATLLDLTPASALIETAIALTVVLAGVNIVVPLFRDSSWRVAGLFGFVHGFGFAGALRELGVGGGDFALSLVMFNVGVEAGQLAVVALVAPLLLLMGALRRTALPMLLVRSSAALTIVVMGLVWMVERGLAIA